MLTDITLISKHKTMRKTILILVATFAAFLTNAQMHISTNLREDYIWSNSKDNWVKTNSDENSNTLFDFNRAQTMFTHTTSSISSTYYIKSIENDKEKGTWEYEVVSDVGNKYLCILDIKNENIRFIRKDKDGTVYLVRHTIKRI